MASVDEFEYYNFILPSKAQKPSGKFVEFLWYIHF